MSSGTNEPTLRREVLQDVSTKDTELQIHPEMQVNINYNTHSDIPHIILSNESQDNRFHSPFVHRLMKSKVQRLVLLYLAGINTEAASDYANQKRVILKRYIGIYRQELLQDLKLVGQELVTRDSDISISQRLHQKVNYVHVQKSSLQALV